MPRRKLERRKKPANVARVRLHYNGLTWRYRRIASRSITIESVARDGRSQLCGNLVVLTQMRPLRWTSYWPSYGQTGRSIDPDENKIGLKVSGGVYGTAWPTITSEIGETQVRNEPSRITKPSRASRFRRRG